MNKLVKSFLMIIYTLVLGCITGCIIWLFIKIMNFGIYFLWDFIPNNTNIPFYTIIVCLIGGILIGLLKRKNGNYPEELNTVVTKVKKTGRYEYNNIISNFVCALSPLIIGASIGPEAGLSGIIAGLFTWIGDKLKNTFKEVKELTSIGITATLGTIFKSPLFGFVEPLESEEETTIPKTSKIVLYFVAILGSFGIFIILNNVFGGGVGFESVGSAELSNINWLYVILLTIIGITMGYIYFASKKLVTIILKPIKNEILVKCIFGSLILGIVGYLLPLTMFSGESQIHIVLENGTSIGILILIITGIVKIFITNICIESGLNGGHFFPMIFSAISIGYAFSIILGVNSVLAMAIVTTAFLSNILKKPLATVLLLMILFEMNLIPIMLGVAIISCYIKQPKWLLKK